MGQHTTIRHLGEEQNWRRYNAVSTLLAVVFGCSYNPGGFRL
jgi:hypothetical protein